MTTIETPLLIPNRSARAAGVTAFRALLARDLHVLVRNLREFIPRTLLQPLLLVFVFAYVFPKIGQGIGGSGAAASAFSTMLVAGVVGGNVAGKASPKFNMGGAGNSITGAIGGLVLGQILERVTGGAMPAADAAAARLALGTTATEVGLLA